MSGWGSSGWGGSGWGGSFGGAMPVATLQLLAALAVAENAVQLTFSAPVYFSQLLDPNDASQPSLFAFVPLPGSPPGLDGEAPHPVSAASVAVSQAPGLPQGSVLVVTLDRPMTPFPSQYVVTASPMILSADTTASLNPSDASQQYGAVFKRVVVPSLASPSSLATRDLASPFDLASAVESRSPTPQGLLSFGVPALDDTGDYATDSGLTNLKKRCIRRCLFTAGATLYLGGGYGAGALGYGKRLASAANRSALAAACESQIAQEPDVAAVSVQTQASRQHPGLYYLVVLVRSRTGQGLKLIVPVTQSAGGGGPFALAA